MDPVTKTGVPIPQLSGSKKADSTREITRRFQAASAVGARPKHSICKGSRPDRAIDSRRRRHIAGVQLQISPGSCKRHERDGYSREAPSTTSLEARRSRRPRPLPSMSWVLTRPTRCLRSPARMLKRGSGGPPLAASRRGRCPRRDRPDRSGRGRSRRGNPRIWPAWPPRRRTPDRASDVVRQLIDARPLERGGGRRPRERQPRGARRGRRPARRSKSLGSDQPSCSGRVHAAACARPADRSRGDCSTSRSRPSTPMSQCRRSTASTTQRRCRRSPSAPETRWPPGARERSFAQLEEAAQPPHEAAARMSARIGARRSTSLHQAEALVAVADPEEAARGACRPCVWRGRSSRPTSRSTRRWCSSSNRPATPCERRSRSGGVKRAAERERAAGARA